MGKRVELAIGALNGAVGDYLARSNNGLATRMSFAREPGEGSESSTPAESTDRPIDLIVLVHGLMCTEHVFSFEDGSDYGSRLASDLGMTPRYVRYNSGLPIADNGVALSELLEAFVRSCARAPARICFVGYSMGGLVVRSACHAATELGHGWLELVDRAIYIGTPHRGAPLERYTRVVTDFLRGIDDPYARFAATLVELRSEGVKDLGDADLRHEDRARRAPRIALRDPKHPVPLLPHIRHCLLAGSLSRDPAYADLFGDALVPIPSATDGRACARAVTRDAEILDASSPIEVRVVPEIHHVGLAHHPEVYRHVCAFLTKEIPS